MLVHPWRDTRLISTTDARHHARIAAEGHRLHQNDIGKILGIEADGRSHQSSGIGNARRLEGSLLCLVRGIRLLLIGGNDHSMYLMNLSQCALSCTTTLRGHDPRIHRDP